MSGRPLGASTGDVLLGLSVLGLIAALVYPRVVTARFQDRVAELAAAVGTVRDGALRYESARGAWPAEAAPGTLPRELTPELPAGFTFVHEGWALDWNRWESVELAEPAPPPEYVPLADDEIEADTVSAPPSTFLTRGSVSVHAGDERLLAELLRRFGGETSFVRDTVWTLVLPRRVVR